MTTAKRIALVAAVLATVAGCSSDLDDLQSRITEVKSRPGGRIEPPGESGSLPISTMSRIDSDVPC